MADAPNRAPARTFWVASLLAVFFFPLWIELQFPGYLKHIAIAIPGAESPDNTEIMPGFWGGDHIQVFYLAWKLKQLFGTPWSILSDPYNFAFADHVLWDFAVSPQYWLIDLFSSSGNIAAYNLGFIIAPLIITFSGGSLLFSSLTSSQWLPWLLAFAITILPMRWQQQVGGHSGGAVFALLPWYWWLLLRSWRGPSRRRDLSVALTLFALAVSDLHLAYYNVLASALFFLSWAIVEARQDGIVAVNRLIRAWPRLLVSLFLAGGYSWLVRYVQSVGLTQEERTPDEVGNFSQPLTSFLSGDGNVGALWLAALAIAIVATLAVDGKRWKEYLSSRYFAIAAILPVFIFGSARSVPGELFSTVALFVAVLVAGLYERVTRLRTDVSRGKVALGVAQGLLAVSAVLQPLQFVRHYATTWPGLKLSDMTSGPQRIFEYLRANARADEIVLHVPFMLQDARYRTIEQYFAYQTGARFAGGYHVFTPEHLIRAAAPIAPFNAGQVTGDQVASVRSFGYRYLLLDTHEMTVPVPAPAELLLRFDQSPYLSKITCDEGYCLYRFVFPGESR